MNTLSKLFYISVICFSFCFSEAQTDIQRVRIDFENPDGYTRHLLLGFVPDNTATDDFDYGYDAPNVDNFPDDLNWIIEDERYVIQGVGEFDTSKYYPLGMFLTNSGNISISLAELENFDNDIDVYLYDTLSDTYTLLNTSNFDLDLSADTYLNRFYITFSTTAHIDIANDNLLSTNEDEIDDLKVWYSKSNNKLYIKGGFVDSSSQISLYSLEGKKVVEEKIVKDNHLINTSEISNGIYIAKIDSASFSYSTKVFITN